VFNALYMLIYPPDPTPPLLPKYHTGSLQLLCIFDHMLFFLFFFLQNNSI